MNTQQNMAPMIQQRSELEAKYYEERLYSENFPVDQLSDQWKKMVKISIMKTSPLMMRISLKEFSDAVECLPALERGDSITLFQFAILSNSLENVSPDDLQLSPLKYWEFVQHATELIEYYNKRQRIIRDEVKRKAQDDINMKAAIEAETKKRGPLSPVRGEA